jgi:hypothetical protein
MDETRALARLPHLEIEIRHRRLPEEQAEQLAISLRATPSFEEFARLLERQVLWPWAALQPWLTSARMVQASWQPWLPASSATSWPMTADDQQRQPEVRSRLPSWEIEWSRPPFSRAMTPGAGAQARARGRGDRSRPRGPACVKGGGRRF